MPPRDNPQPATGTAKISGRIVAADTSSPVRRAQISLSSRDTGVSRTMTTDSDGRYEIADLPAGRYRLAVSKAGYVPLEYGQARPFEPGKPLDLAEGQALEKIDFSLARGSVITGRITDEFGDAVTDVQVQALRYQFVNGERRLVNAGRVSRTDDLGQFRIFGLMPGDYIVQASLRDGQAASRDGAAEGYPGTYFPGVTDAGQAQVVTVALGQELGGVAFPLVPARLARVSGTVMSSDGRPLARALLMLRPRTAGGGSIGNLLAGAGRSQTDGSGAFRMSNIPPGDYVLEVQERPDGPPNLRSALTQLEFASTPVSVSGGDIDNLTVVTTAGVTLSGRVVFPATGERPSTLQVTAVGGDGAPSLRGLAGRALGGGRMGGDGTFELYGLVGPQLIRVQGLPSGLALKSVAIDGIDVTDVPYEFRPGANVANVVITLTDRITEITGSVRDPRGPAADYVVVVFPEDPKLWGARSRHVTTGRPNQNGTFSIKGLPPARYLAVVLPSLETGQQSDPGLLERLRPYARSVTLAEGQTLNLNLEMAAP